MNRVERETKCMAPRVNLFITLDFSLAKWSFCKSTQFSFEITITDRISRKINI